PIQNAAEVHPVGLCSVRRIDALRNGFKKAGRRQNWNSLEWVEDQQILVAGHQAICTTNDRDLQQLVVVRITTDRHLRFCSQARKLRKRTIHAQRSMRSWSTLSRKQFERLRQAWTDADRAEVAPVGRKHTVDPAALRDGGDRAVDEPQLEIL